MTADDDLAQLFADDEPDRFTGMVNLFHTIHCEAAELSIQQIGDILYYDANHMTCEYSRRLALATFAYLGIPTSDDDINDVLPGVDEALRSGGGTLESVPDNPDDDDA